MDGGLLLSVKEELNEDHNNFMDLSAIGCSLLLDQQADTAGITVTMTGPSAGTSSLTIGNSYQRRSSFLSPAPPPPYPAGLTPYQTPYVSPYATPFQTPSPSPLSSLHSSPATSGRMTKEPGIDQELAMILESDPFIWEQQPAQALPPPPYPHADRVTGRPPHPQPSRTQLKQQLQRQQLEQQERREREMSNLQSGGRASSCPVEKMGIPIISQPEFSADPVSVPPQVLTVRTRLENPTLYHVIESRRRQVREFLQQEQHQSIPHDQRSTASSAPPGGFVVVQTPTGTSTDAGAAAPEVLTLTFYSDLPSAVRLSDRLVDRRDCASHCGDATPPASRGLDYSSSYSIPMERR